MDGVISHFWVAAGPLCSTTLLVAPGFAEERSDARSENGVDAGGSADSSAVVSLEFFDADGVQVNEARVDFPSGEVGVIQLEPFCAAFKCQAGFPHGRVKVVSPAVGRVVCRYQLATSPTIIAEPKCLRPRESVSLPVMLGPRREHLLVVLNVGAEDAQVVSRLFYGSRSPEWGIDVPAGGSRVVGLEQELLADFEDKELAAGNNQGYLRFSPRQHSYVACQVIERIVGEAGSEESCKVLTTW